MAPWPEPRLALSAAITQDEQGRSLVTFTVTNAKDTSGTGSATLLPGDGTGAVPVPLDTAGSGSVVHRYLQAGHHTYTATVTAAMPQLYATWEDLAAANAAWDAVESSFTPWSAATGTTEIATTQVTVDVGTVTIWAEVIDEQPIPYVQINVWFAFPDDVNFWSLTRNSPGAVPAQNVMIYARTVAGDTEQVADREAPIDIATSYTLNVTYTATSKRTPDTATSNQVTITGVTGCFLTDVQTGTTMSIEVQEWPARDTASRRSVLAVAGRTDPIVLSDLNLLPSGQWTLQTRTKEALEQLYGIIGNARMVLLRTQAASSLRTVYAATGNLSENRYYPYDGTAWARLTDVDFQEVMPVPATARMLVVTWLQLAAAYGTWADVAAAFPSWLDVAEWNPNAVEARWIPVTGPLESADA